MKRVIYLCLFIPLLFSGCVKEVDDNNTVQQLKEKVTDYFPLAVGNYWIYQQYNCDSLEYDCEEYKIDSIYISDTTIIDGKKYYKMITAHPNNDLEILVRDSNDYIINSNGTIIFALHHYDTVLYSHVEKRIDSSIILTEEYSISEEKVNRIIGEITYECYNYKGEIYLEKDNFSQPRYCNNLYAKNVGLVYENNFYASSEGGILRELIRYSVQQ